MGVLLSRLLGFEYSKVFVFNFLNVFNTQYWLRWASSLLENLLDSLLGSQSYDYIGS
jgi:hypothetical protein